MLISSISRAWIVKAFETLQLSAVVAVKKQKLKGPRKQTVHQAIRETLKSTENGANNRKVN